LWVSVSAPDVRTGVADFALGESRPSLFSVRNARVAFSIVLMGWMLYPFAVRDQVAQDAIPMVVAAELVSREPEAVYPAEGEIGIPAARFKASSCEYYDTARACRDFAVSFISPPIALPLIKLLPYSPEGASLAFRLLGACSPKLAGSGR
jgi:hypothetical protein